MTKWVQYPQVGREEIFDWVRPQYSALNLEKIVTAYSLSKYGHKGQIRDDGRRYFEHPKAVFWIIAYELGLVDWKTLVMALLHDVQEDTFLLSDYRIEVNFGREVAEGVRLLTKDSSEYLERLRRFATWRVLLVKVADRLHNVRTLGACTPEKITRKVAETQEHYLPLADLLIERAPKKRRGAAVEVRGLLVAALVDLS